MITTMIYHYTNPSGAVISVSESAKDVVGHEELRSENALYLWRRIVQGN